MRAFTLEDWQRMGNLKKHLDSLNDSIAELESQCEMPPPAPEDIKINSGKVHRPDDKIVILIELREKRDKIVVKVNRYKHRIDRELSKLQNAGQRKVMQACYLDGMIMPNGKMSKDIEAITGYCLRHCERLKNAAYVSLGLNGERNADT